MESCEICKFFSADVSDFIEGDYIVASCLRYPPVFVGLDATTNGAQFIFPVVEGDEWCGEYQPK